MSSAVSLLISGIQDLAVLLPLVGTELCETHLGSGLEHGFLYPAVVPLSIFGLLGIVNGGAKVFFASITYRKGQFLGAQKVKESGFATSDRGSLSSITMKEDCFRCETEVIDMLKKLDLNSPEKLTVSRTLGMEVWNWRLTLATAVSCLVSTVPYIGLDLWGDGFHQDYTKWLFPTCKAVGSLFTVVCAQLLMQHRILVIVKNRLSFMAMDVVIKQSGVKDRPKFWGEEIPSERCLFSLDTFLSDLGEPSVEDDQRWLHSLHLLTLSPQLLGHGPNLNDHEKGKVIPLHAATWQEHWRTNLNKIVTMHGLQESSAASIPLSQLLLLIGVILSVVGYVGCFSLVRSGGTVTGTVAWLVCELVLSLVRVLFWIINPSRDDNRGLQFQLSLNKSLTSTPERSPVKMVKSNERTVRVDAEQTFFQNLTGYIGPRISRMPPVHSQLTFHYALEKQDSNSRSLLFIALRDIGDGVSLVFRYSRAEHVNMEPSDRCFMAKIEWRRTAWRAHLKQEVLFNEDGSIKHNVKDLPKDLKLRLRDHAAAIFRHLDARDASAGTSDECLFRRKWRVDAVPALERLGNHTLSEL